MHYLLAGDIGGTKTVLALYPLDAGTDLSSPVVCHTYQSAHYQTFEAVVTAFLGEEGDRVTAASFGVAGPVLNGRVEVTNLPWIIDVATLRPTIGSDHVYLLNDLEAIANAVPYLAPNQLVTVNEGRQIPDGPMAIIAPGTGLGEAFLVHDGHRYLAFPSEGGHATFSPVNALQRALMAYMQGRFDHVSFERVCSGKAIPDLYRFFHDEIRYTEPEWLRRDLASAPDQTPIIVNAARTGSAEICVATLDLFIDILANETGNLAIRLLATGGIYLGGGIPPRIIPQLTDGDFLRRYVFKGRFTDLVSQMPVHIIKEPLAALHGAAHYALSQTDKR